MSQIFKIKLFDKREGETSYSSLYPLKKEFKGEKIGHAGTLDKFASGLMISLIGNATKLNSLFSSFGKKYRAVIQFGKETDTLDPEGNVIASGAIPKKDKVLKVLGTFIGKQKQIPPMYSALHVNGKRAYEIARSGNIIDMKERDIFIKDLSLISFDEQNGIAIIEAEVSKGTYIRSLARDIALKAGSRGYLIGLKRLEIGPFMLEDTELCTKELLDKTNLFTSIYFKEIERKKIENGLVELNKAFMDENKNKKYFYLYLENELYAIAERKDNNKAKIITRCYGSF